MAVIVVSVVEVVVVVVFVIEIVRMVIVVVVEVIVVVGVVVVARLVAEADASPLTHRDRSQPSPRALSTRWSTPRPPARCNSFSCTSTPTGLGPSRSSSTPKRGASRRCSSRWMRRSSVGGRRWVEWPSRGEVFLALGLSVQVSRSTSLGVRD
jgi:hypothetical protein